jgi:hypothetical protein
MYITRATYCVRALSVHACVRTHSARACVRPPFDGSATNLVGTFLGLPVMASATYFSYTRITTVRVCKEACAVVNNLTNRLHTWCKHSSGQQDSTTSKWDIDGLLNECVRTNRARVCASARVHLCVFVLIVMFWPSPRLTPVLVCNHSLKWPMSCPVVSILYMRPNCSPTTGAPRTCAPAWCGYGQV